MRDMLDSDGSVQRWRFESAKHAKAAAAALRKQKKPKDLRKLPDWVEIDRAQLEPLFEANDVPMIARYEVAKRGPLTLTRDLPFL